MKKQLILITSLAVLCGTLVACTPKEDSKSTEANQKVTQSTTTPIVVKPSAKSMFNKDVTITTNTNGIYPIYKDGKSGYANNEGKTIIKPTYLSVLPFNKYAGIVSYVGDGGNKIQNLVNVKGQKLLPDNYTKIQQLDDEGKYYVASNKDESFIFNINGEKVLTLPKDIQVDPGAKLDSQERILVTKNVPMSIEPSGKDYKGFIDLSGHHYLLGWKDAYTTLFNYENGRTIASKVNEDEESSTICIVDLSGKCVYDVDKNVDGYNLFSGFSDGLSLERNYDDGHSPAAYINTDGQVVVGNKEAYYYLGDFHEGLAVVIPYNSNKYGYVNKHLKVAIKADYTKAGDFKNGLAIVQKGDKTGVINNKGSVVVDFKYDRINDFDSHGVAQAVKDGEVIYINKEGKELFSGGKR